MTTTRGRRRSSPTSPSRTSLAPLMGLSGVHVLAVTRDGAAYIGFEFGCVWDGEHGAGVMTHRGQVVATGQADVSFLAWVARRDADQRASSA